MSKEHATRSFISPRCRLVIEMSYWASWPRPEHGGECPATSDGRHARSKV